MSRFLAVLLCASVITGCSPRPTPTFFPATQQMVLASASQWQMIAQDAADAMDVVPGGYVILWPYAGASAFGHVFHGMLETALVQRGADVAQAGALPIITFGAEVVPDGRAGRSGPVVLVGPGGRIVPLDAREKSHRVDDYAEVVVTVSKTVGGLMVRRYEEVFYVSPQDLSDYRSVHFVFVQPPLLSPAPVQNSRIGERMLVIDRYGERTVVVGR
jgi:hypothetical protein